MLDIANMENPDQTHPSGSSPPASLLNTYIDLACSQSKTVQRTLGQYGSQSLRTFLEDLSYKTGESYQPREALLEAVRDYVTPLLGEAVADQTVSDLAASPMVMTANHHGVDYFAQSVQGTLIFSLKNRVNGHKAQTVPIFSCGNIPLNNMTYPRGMLVYKVNPAFLDKMPMKVPIFSEKQKRKMVSVVPGMDAPMIQRAHQRIQNLIKKKQIDPGLENTLQAILKLDYNAESTLNLPDYSRQAVVINNRLWKRLFADPASAPDLVYLELEKIIGLVLEQDLSDPTSLAWLVMFTPRIRTHLLKQLDGAKACWDTRMLMDRLAQAGDLPPAAKNTNGCGTCFFWGLDNAGKRIPLYLEETENGAAVLRGIDDKGRPLCLTFHPEKVTEELMAGRLLPSLFTCYLVLALARGITSVGGYYQAEYLPVIQKGVVEALNQDPAWEKCAHTVSKVPTDVYLSGMQTVMTELSSKGLIPAGVAEIINAGGLTEQDLIQIIQLSVYDAHLASLFDTMPDIAPWHMKNAGWKYQLAAECDIELRDKVVVK
jgi:hypothetical protein